MGDQSTLTFIFKASVSSSQISPHLKDKKTHNNNLEYTFHNSSCAQIIHKNGNQFDPNNYRGITLNSCFGKLFCHVLNNRITFELESMSFLKSQQAGFRSNHRTSDQLFILRTVVDKTMC